MSNLALTHTLLEVLDKPASMISHVADRPGHDRRYAVDCTKIERELGWRPLIPFERGIRETIAWYRSNADWVRQVCSGEYRRYCRRQYGLAACA
jgi:dTDP-glucose 4,6-dehydratase